MLRIPLELHAALARRQRERHDYSEKHAALLDLLSRPKKDRTELCDKLQIARIMFMRLLFRFGLNACWEMSRLNCELCCVLASLAQRALAF
jgi:hypothetical protein